MTRIYEGEFEGDERNAMEHRVVVVEAGRRRPLRWRLDLANHSPTGLSWGYQGSGPAQCALAILADALGDDRRAVELHQAFKRECIALLSQTRRWVMNQDDVLAWAKAKTDA